MAFEWVLPGYQLVTVKFEWNVQVPFLQTYGYGKGETLESPLFSPQETPNSKWKLKVRDICCEESHIVDVPSSGVNLNIIMYHCNSAGEHAHFVEPVLVTLSILNNKREKFFKQMLSETQWLGLEAVGSVEFFLINKQHIIEAQCQQPDGSVTFCGKIRTHVKRETESSKSSDGDRQMGKDETRKCRRVV